MNGAAKTALTGLIDGAMPRTDRPGRSWIAGIPVRKRLPAKRLIRQKKMGNGKFPLSAPVRDFAGGSAQTAGKRRERHSRISAGPWIATPKRARARVILPIGTGCRTDHQHRQICARSSIPGWIA